MTARDKEEALAYIANRLENMVEVSRRDEYMAWLMLTEIGGNC